jgi:lipopolysaccharide/colanic/teichoic acid biosynthesis glycosyltransferase
MERPLRLLDVPQSSRTQVRSAPPGTRTVLAPYWRYKVVPEWILACILFVVFLPLLLVLMLLVRLTSRGPAIYKQTRVGLHGRQYRIYKLRTMYVDAEKHTGPVWAKPNDSRVTPFGRFLRKTHLDEIPQLVNVIRGDMGLIGPRPERPEFVERLAREIPGYMERHVVRPGITGLAQIHLPPDQDIDGVRVKLAYDLHYIKTANFWLDVRILCCTALRLFGLGGAAAARLCRVPPLVVATAQETR